MTTTRRALLSLVALGLVALYLPTFRWLYDRWTLSVWHHAHGFIIPPVVAYFVHQELRAFRHVPASASAWGFAILVPALMLQVMDTGLHTQLLAAISFVLVLPGLSLLFLGVQRTAAIAFPLVFSAFMLPIPLSLSETVHMVLRKIATAGTEPIVRLAGIPVFSEGTTLHLPNTTLMVADACSGFSTLYASAAVACLVAYTTRNPWRRAAILAAAAPLAILANLVRVVMLVLAVHWTSSDVLHTWFHPFSGMLTFALALPALFWLGQAGVAHPVQRASELQA